MPSEADTPLLDMVVKRISEEVASVLKVDPSNVEEHLGTCLADEVMFHGDKNKAIVAKTGIDPESQDLDVRLRDALSRLEERKAQRIATRETAPIPLRKPVPKIDMEQLERAGKEDTQKSKSVLNNPSMGSPRVCAPGQFSSKGRTSSPRRARPKSASMLSRGSGKMRTSSPSRKKYGDSFSDSKAYRVGGGYVSQPPPPRPPKSPERLEQDDVRLKVAAAVSAEANGAPVKKLNERQWEKVVTRLYGTPGGEDDPMNRHKQVDNNNSVKMHPVEIERAVDRLYNPNPKKKQWLLQQRVAILDKELRSCQAKPRISKTSERMASGKLHIVDRVDAIIQERQQKMAELISQVEQEEGGAIKGSPYISPRAKQMPRSYQDLMSWDAERTERLQQQREAKVVDEISCPFHPEIDEYSEELAIRRYHKEGLTEVPAEERLYSLRELPTEDQVRTARMIHQEDLKHSLALSAEYM